MKKIVILFLAASLMLTNVIEAKAGVLTPYETEKNSAEFVNGATFVLEQRNDYEEWLNRELGRAKNTYHINTITVYGLEQYDDAYKTCLFETLKKLDMKICIRIEAYDGETFAFTEEDAADVIRRHKELVEFTCLPENREVVFYYAINMPVDDGKVQEHLGGVNSQQCKDSQVSYAEEIVRQMRELTKAGGYEEAKLYLSVFFGWDAAYEIPSYASANADGYFINNYTYPIEGELPGADSEKADIINAERLKRTMDKFLEVYPEQPPLMIETGFHTLEYNHGIMPSQTAGLVKDWATKAVALKAMCSFYQENYSNVIGILYFGYNLFNQEGNPPAEMDWALLYPAETDNEAEGNNSASNDENTGDNTENDGSSNIENDSIGNSSSNENADINNNTIDVSGTVSDNAPVLPPDNTNAGQSKDHEPKTGDNTPLELFVILVMILGLVYLITYLPDYRHNMTEKKKE